MQPTTTTNIKLQPLLDLLTTSPSAATDRGPSVFDALLQPPGAPPANVTPPRPDTAGETSSPAASEKDKPEARAERPKTSDAKGTPREHDANEPAEPTQHLDPPPASRTDEKQPDPSLDSSESPTLSVATAEEQSVNESDSLVAESLAGMSAVATSPVQTLDDPGPELETPATEPDAKSKTGSHQPIGAVVTVDDRSTAAKPRALQNSDADAKPDHTAKSSLPQSSTADSNPHRDQDDPEREPLEAARVSDGSDPLKLTADEASSESDQALSAIGPTEPKESKLKSSADLPPDLTVASHPVDVMDATSPTAIAPLTASPVGTPTQESAASTKPAVREASNGPGPINAASAGGAPAGRSRIPGEILSPAPAHGPRRPQLEVDTTRLLTRVARAFAAASERDGEVHLRLSPPELGSLKLDIRVSDGALTAHLQTETQTARSALIDNLPALRERLAEQGIRVERFEVDLMQPQSGGLPNQTGGGQQQEMPQQQAMRPRAPLRPAASATPSVAASGLPINSTSGLNVVI